VDNHHVLTSCYPNPSPAQSHNQCSLSYPKYQVRHVRVVERVDGVAVHRDTVWAIDVEEAQWTKVAPDPWAAASVGEGEGTDTKTGVEIGFWSVETSNEKAHGAGVD
jgi:hypothetical protein